MSWVVIAGGHSGDVVRSVIPAAVDNRFGAMLKVLEEIEWLPDSGLDYMVERNSTFAVELGLKPLTMPVCRLQSNGMAESFVTTMKRGYILLHVQAECRDGGTQAGHRLLALQQTAFL